MFLLLPFALQPDLPISPVRRLHLPMATKKLDIHY